MNSYYKLDQLTKMDKWLIITQNFKIDGLYTNVKIIAI